MIINQTVDDNWAFVFNAEVHVFCGQLVRSNSHVIPNMKLENLAIAS
jgi:hypothetical protein